MATTLEILTLRQLIGDETEPLQFTDADLSAHIDANGSVGAAAGVVWSIKAARLADLVDVTEGSSSRKLSQLQKQALDMAAHYGSDASTATAGRSGTRPISRP